MNRPTHVREVFVGIDVAIAKRKRLPISVCELQDDTLEPLPLRLGFNKPPAGMGNKAALEAATRATFATAVSGWLKSLQKEKQLSVRCVAIDAPSAYCQSGLVRRLSELALDRAGISCFATPTMKQFDEKVRAARSHIQNGGKEAEMPNANQIWMLVGFALFDRLTADGFECIETYPQAIVHELQCSAKHKSTKEGYAGQLQNAAMAASFSSTDSLQTALDRMGYGKQDDKLDAFLSAWVASLPSSKQKVYGSKPNDAIVVPNMDVIQKSSAKSGAAK